MVLSATNRGITRRPSDLYETPEEVTRDFLFNHFEGDYKQILEPCAGTGKMSKVLRERYSNSHITAIEPFFNGTIEGSDVKIVMDFLKFPEESGNNNKDFDLIFTNPPYSQAQEIIDHALNTWPNTTVVMLLRLNFLGSQKRHGWWQKHLPTEVHVLSKRPSFTGKGTDATEYAWFVWRPGVKKQKINVIWGCNN